MPRSAATVALWLALPALAAAQQGRNAPAPTLRLLDVPFVSQDERLCGGAAAAMLLRAAGARGVYASDFAPLLDARAGGIHTSDLEAALRARGHDVRATSGTPSDARAQLAGGRPVLALIEDRPGVYHYVVLVGWSGGAVVYHDPARAPFVARRDAEFDRAWSKAERWMLTIDAPRRPAGRISDSEPSAYAADPAVRHFTAGEYREAAREARAAAGRKPGDADAWRLLGASLYLLGDLPGALDAWNRAGSPTVDLIRIEGLDRTPHRVVENLIGVEPGQTLTRSALARASRRLSQLPSQQGSRVTYVALPGNLAEVRGAILERDRYPSRAQWMFEAARVPIEREAGVSLSNLASHGDRLAAAWRFAEGRPRAAVEFAFPAPSRPGGFPGLWPGVWKLSTAWQQEHYADAPRTDTRDARLGWTNWVGARTRVETGAGVARRRDLGTQALLDGALEFRPLRNAVSLEIAAAGAAGTAPFGAAAGTFRWQLKRDAARLVGTAALSTVTGGAPRDRWPGADSRTTRPLLLRAHPLMEDGRIAGPVFGRTVAHGSVEVQRHALRRGLFSAGVAAFTDVARAWRRHDGSDSLLHVDAGVGVRLRLAAGQPAIRIDLARGLRDGRMALSAGWEVPW